MFFFFVQNPLRGRATSTGFVEHAGTVVYRDKVRTMIVFTRAFCRAGRDALPWCCYLRLLAVLFFSTSYQSAASSGRRGCVDAQSRPRKSGNGTFLCVCLRTTFTTHNTRL